MVRLVILVSFMVLFFPADQFTLTQIDQGYCVSVLHQGNKLLQRQRSAEQIAWVRLVAFKIQIFEVHLRDADAGISSTALRPKVREKLPLKVTLLIAASKKDH